MLKLSKHTTI